MKSLKNTSISSFAVHTKLLDNKKERIEKGNIYFIVLKISRAFPKTYF